MKEKKEWMKRRGRRIYSNEIFRKKTNKSQLKENVTNEVTS